MIKWIKLHWKAFKVDIKYYWRMLRSRCLSCGNRCGHVGKPENWISDTGGKCYHCQTNKNYCHWCNKRLNHIMNYGISGARMKNVLGK